MWWLLDSNVAVNLMCVVLEYYILCVILEYYATLRCVGAVEHDAVNLSVSIKYPLLYVTTAHLMSE